MAEVEVVEAPGQLACYGIGSCVVVTLFDPVAKVAGMAHAMLPSAPAGMEAEENPAKFADTAVADLIERMKKLGARSERMVARLVGGATMFSFSGQGNKDQPSLGDRNSKTARDSLVANGLLLQAEDTGGNFGRSIELSAEDGSLQVRTAARGTRWL